MGEYVRINGEAVKLGTCEDLMYCRYDQAESRWQQWGKQPGNLPPGDYLKESHGFRFRFPFPDEDEIDVGCFEEHDRGVRVVVSDELWAALDLTDHDKFWVTVAPKHKDTALHYESAGFNIELPCPAVNDYSDHRTSIRTPLHMVDIVQQRPFEGALWTVVRCPWCGNLWRVPPAVGYLLADAIASYGMQYPEMFWVGMAGRIAAGYDKAVAETAALAQATETD